MRPLTLHLTSFGSFRGLHELDLSGISCAVLSGNNGSGKSTLAVDALLWPLFGEARGDLDSIVSEGEEVGRVELLFGLGETGYGISRQRSTKGAGKTTTSFWQVSPDGPIMLTGKGEKETQERIESLLHMNSTLFRQTALSAQGEAGLFSRARPADRKQLLGEILDLGAWEKRAQAARAMLTELLARLEAQKQRHVGLTEAFGQASGLRYQLSENETAQAILAGEISQLEKALAEAQEAKAKLLADQQADGAKRKVLEDLTERLTALEKQIATATGRLADLDKAVAAKPKLEGEIAANESAQTEAQELEARRQERERIEAQARTLAEQVKGAKDGHAASIHEVEKLIAWGKQHQQTQIEPLKKAITTAGKQSAVLDTVPCAAAGNTPLVDKCPLVAQAREARELLSHLEEQLAELQAQTPWADDEKRLAELQAQTPAADLIAQKAKLKEEFDAIVYDAGAHAALRQAGGRLDSLRQALSRAEAAEAARAEVETGLKGSRAEASGLTEQRTALTTELGPPRDWTSAITDIGAQITRSTDTLGEARRREQALIGGRGTLDEKLRAAEQAGKDAELLIAEIAEGERRCKLLRILGNTQDGAFSKSGIPARLIDAALPEIEEAANEVLHVLSDGKFSLELRTQREGKDGLAETLDVIVIGRRGPRAYEMFSGGQKTRIDYAIRAGLARSLAKRAGARCDVLILDEPEALDEPGQDELVECLGRLSAFFSLILLVTHIDRLKHAFPYRIEVSQDEMEDSHVEVIAG